MHFDESVDFLKLETESFAENKQNLSASLKGSKGLSWDVAC